MTDKDTFLRALSGDGKWNRDLHFVFADWLEEQGLCDEAQRERTWTRERQEAEDWLTEYMRNFSDYYWVQDDDGEDHRENTVPHFASLDQFLDAAREYASKNKEWVGSDDWGFNRGFYCLPFDTPDICWNKETNKTMWRHLKVLGIDPGGEQNEGNFFRCSC